MVDKEKYIIVYTEGIPSVYIAITDDLDWLIKQAPNPHWDATIFRIRAQVSQTPNPINGVLLEKVAHLLPVDDFKVRLNSLLFAFEGYPPEQLDDMLEESFVAIRHRVERAKGQFSEAHKNTEVIDLWKESIDNAEVPTQEVPATDNISPTAGTPITGGGNMADNVPVRSDVQPNTNTPT